jgi:YHS domain-containing protein
MRTLKVGLVLFMLSSASLAFAQEESVVNAEDGIAIKGYDPVAYFTEGEPVEGDPEITFDWSGATWRFANEEHRMMFAEDPERYAPAYGGYCAWAVSRGSVADIDPHAWVVHNDRLFLNVSRFIGARFRLRLESNIERADENWPEVRRSVSE